MDVSKFKTLLKFKAVSGNKWEISTKISILNCLSFVYYIGNIMKKDCFVFPSIIHLISSLLPAIFELNGICHHFQTNFQLRRLAEKKGPDEEDLAKLASTLDEFIFRLFDPLKSGGRIRDVFLKAAVDDVMDAAIEFEQKNVSSVVVREI